MTSIFETDIFLRLVETECMHDTHMLHCGQDFLQQLQHLQDASIRRAGEKLKPYLQSEIWQQNRTLPKAGSICACRQLTVTTLD